MRLWSLHPAHLDGRGLVALWREGLLARAVLAGQTRGYVHHPQLTRFRDQPEPLAAIEYYLSEVLEEAVGRGYAFDGGKVAQRGRVEPIDVSGGQLDHEIHHLAAKLSVRSPVDHVRLMEDAAAGGIRPHPSFRVVPGTVADWERATRAP